MQTMKQSISVTVEMELVEWIDAQVATQKYRNRSHLVELALMKFRELLRELEQPTSKT
jgi:Arc/MetJ-type ribon-helix-helix transcriptional regulator